MIDRDAELIYFDNELKTITVTRNRYGRLHDFYNAIESLMKSIFKSSSVRQIEVYYHQYKDSILYTRDEVLNKNFKLKRVKKKRGYYL